MAAEKGGWRRVCAAVRSGQVVRKPAFKAAIQVDRGDENMVAW